MTNETKRTTPLYQRLSALLLQRENCAKAVPRNDTWFDIATSRIIELVREFMPSGSGFDNGTELDLDRSTSEKLVFVVVRSHGFIYNISSYVVSDDLDRIAAENCQCGGNHGNR
jgi:hypothetical protein